MANQVKLNLSGFREYRRDPTVKAAITAQAELVAATADSMAVKPRVHYEVEPAIDSTRGSVALVTTGYRTEHSGQNIADNAVYDTLRRALGSLGGA